MELTEDVVKNILNLGFILEEMVILLSRKDQDIDLIDYEVIEENLFPLMEMNEAGETTFLRAQMETSTLETYFLLLDRIFESDILDSA